MLFGCNIGKLEPLNKRIYVATDKCIPKTKPYSPDYATDKHDLTRQAFVQWMYVRKPRCGQSLSICIAPGLLSNKHCGSAGIVKLSCRLTTENDTNSGP